MIIIQFILHHARTFPQRALIMRTCASFAGKLARFCKLLSGKIISSPSIGPFFTPDRTINSTAEFFAWYNRTHWYGVCVCVYGRYGRNRHTLLCPDDEGPPHLICFIKSISLRTRFTVCARSHARSNKSRLLSSGGDPCRSSMNWRWGKHHMKGAHRKLQDSPPFSYHRLLEASGRLSQRFRNPPIDMNVSAPLFGSLSHLCALMGPRLSSNI